MKEDLNICQNALFKTQEENKKLLSQMDGGQTTTNDGSYSSTTDRVSGFSHWFISGPISLVHFS